MNQTNVFPLGPEAVEELRTERRKVAARLVAIDRLLEDSTRCVPGMPGEETRLRQIVQYVADHPGVTARQISEGMTGGVTSAITASVADLATLRRVLRRERIRAKDGAPRWHYWVRP